MSKGRPEKESKEIAPGFSFSRMHRMLKEKKKEEEKKSEAPVKKAVKAPQEKKAPKPAKTSGIEPVVVQEEIPLTAPVREKALPQAPFKSPDPVLTPETVSPAPPPLSELLPSATTIPESPQLFTPAARTPFPASRFTGGEKRTTIRISNDLADRAKEFENKVYWLTKKRLSLAEQARIALTLFLELPLDLEDMTADDDMELYILQKARKLLSGLDPQQTPPGRINP
ncbi:MAG: hypothetical protein M1269_00920 [Chloroflexi bacterium]|nr:hypothetical protein [Chloroflexota bacterium]